MRIKRIWIVGLLFSVLLGWTGFQSVQSGSFPCDPCVSPGINAWSERPGEWGKAKELLRENTAQGGLGDFSEVTVSLSL